MYIRKSKVKGNVYYALVEGYRDPIGRVRQKTIASLGRSATIPEAIRTLESEVQVERERFAKVAAACVDLLREYEFDPPPSLVEVAEGGLPENAEELGVFQKLFDELEIESEDFKNAERLENEDDLPWMDHARHKFILIHRRIKDKLEKLAKLKELQAEFQS
jgi:hypothetical protein